MNRGQEEKKVEEIFLRKYFQETVKATCLKKKNRSGPYEVKEDEVEIMVEMYWYESSGGTQNPRKKSRGIIIKLINCPYSKNNSRGCCNLSESDLPKERNPDTDFAVNCHVYNPPLGHLTENMIRW